MNMIGAITVDGHDVDLSGMPLGEDQFVESSEPDGDQTVVNVFLGETDGFSTAQEQYLDAHHDVIVYTHFAE
jgi:hypothetical protein